MISIIDPEELKHVLRPTVFLRADRRPAGPPTPRKEPDAESDDLDRGDRMHASDRPTAGAS
jgi:hypothetical protein